jgi:rare lipoprotein A (peptidoglycan hydrolase)
MDRSLRLGKLNRNVCAASIAMVAAITLFALAGTGFAHASSGGLGLTAPQNTQTQPAPAKTVKKTAAPRGARFGNRTLRRGMVGPDVRVLKSIVRSKRLLSGALTNTFDRPTVSAVRRFQGSANIGRSGVVNRATARKMVGSLRTSEASWYGPGLWGNGTACGRVTLRPRTIGVANKNLPCGTRVLFGYRGKYIIAPVIDRGPYIAGRTWDLTKAASDAIGLTGAGVGRVRHAIISRGR